MIRVRDLHKTYRRGGADVHALRGVDLDVEPGQVLALTGRSGAGKSTLLNLVAGLLRADRGSITVDGLERHRRPRRRADRDCGATPSA